MDWYLNKAKKKVTVLNNITCEKFGNIYMRIGTHEWSIVLFLAMLSLKKIWNACSTANTSLFEWYICQTNMDIGIRGCHVPIFSFKLKMSHLKSEIFTKNVREQSIEIMKIITNALFLFFSLSQSLQTSYWLVTHDSQQ